MSDDRDTKYGMMFTEREWVEIAGVLYSEAEKLGSYPSMLRGDAGVQAMLRGYYDTIIRNLDKMTGEIR